MDTEFRPKFCNPSPETAIPYVNEIVSNDTDTTENQPNIIDRISVPKYFD